VTADELFLTHTPLPELLRRVCETPAPTFSEQQRAAVVHEVLQQAGLTPQLDDVGNVLAELPGGTGPRVALVAHLDSVFGPEVDVTIRETSSERWAAPGIGDNAASVAVLLGLAQQLSGLGEARPRLLLAFTVGEEGLGDLRGARHLVASHGEAIDVFLAVDGHLGTVIDAGVGSRRFRFSYAAEGGHSWGDFPSPSAVHALGDAIHAVTRIPLPEEHRSSFNVAEVVGGTAINAIATSASATLDLRSVDESSLRQMVEETEQRLRSVARRHRVGLEVEVLGERPAGKTDDGRLWEAARDALAEMGIEAKRSSSSTDANAAMPQGIPAICLGVYRGGNAHRLDEWADPTSLEVGFTVLLSMLRKLATR